MERRKPTYNLKELPSLVEQGGLSRRITDRARADAESLGFVEEQDIVDVVLHLAESDFDVSLESETKLGLWQDVYWPVVNGRRLYVELQCMQRKDGNAAVIISFHNNTARRSVGVRGKNFMRSTDECHVCGGEARLIREPVELRVGRRRITVPAERWRCQECGEVYYSGGQLEAAQRDAASVVRSRCNALDPAAIKEIRDDLGLSQPTFEALIGAGPKTVIRWERGTVVPNATANLLLLAVRDVSGMASYLAKLHNVELPCKDDWALDINEVVAPQDAAIPAAVRRRSAVPVIPADELLDSTANEIQQSITNVISIGKGENAA